MKLVRNKMMIKFFKALVVGALLANASSLVEAKETNLVDGLAVVITSENEQAQVMAMVLSLQTIKAHGKEAHITLCGPAGNLALRSTVTKPMKPMDASPSMMLKKLIQLGAKVELCPLYLPNKPGSDNALIEGITVAKPVEVAERLLNSNFKNLTY